MSAADIRALALRHGPLVGCALILAWHSLQYSFVTDDAYISFVYSRNLAEHGQLVFNPGLDPVEGYTNFLWTFLLGLLMVVGLAPEVTSLVLGTAFGMATFWVAFRLVEHVMERRTPWAYLPALLLALSSGYACWSSGGLETQLFTFLVTLAVYAYARGDVEARWLRWAGLFLALAAMTRPEGLLVTAAIGLHRLGANLVRERRLVPSRDELWCLGLFLAVWGPWYAWRWWYYGYPFPNTYYVKAAGEPPPGYKDALVDNGLYYVWQWLRQTRLLWVAPLAVAGLAVARPRSRRFYLGSLLLPLALVYLAYTVRVGGDFMGLHRFVMPLFVVAALGVTLGLALLVNLVPARRRDVSGVAAAALLVGAFSVAQYRLTVESLRWGNWAADHGIDTPAYLDVYAHDRARIGEHMRDCFRPGDFSIVGGAGAKPYHGRVRGFDVFGLVSEAVAHEVAPNRPRAGHNKWAPDSLLHRHEPEFVFSCYAIHAGPETPRLGCANFWLQRGYELATLHVPGLKQQGEYYTFVVRKDRNFKCPGLVK